MALVVLTGAAVQAREITPDDLRALSVVDVVILGEVHDNAEHHRNQAVALAALRPSAVVFEMLSPEQALVADRREISGQMLADAIDWDASGWPPFEIYQPVFDAVGTARVIGMAVPRDQVRAAFSDGADQAFGDGAARFGLNVPLPEDEQAAREAMQATAHCDALPVDMLPGMVSAQRLRDAAFADTVLRALSETGGPVAVITGTGHARTDWGMPAALQRARPEVRVLSIGQIEDHGEAFDAPPFDLWLVTPPAERPDPCAALRARGEDG